MSARADWSVAGGDPAGRARAYGMPGVQADGMDFFAVYGAARELVARARRGEGPAYLVCDTYRYHGHHAGDPLNYRAKHETEEWRRHDPIERLQAALVARGILAEQQAAAIEQQVAAAVEEAVAFARSSPEPTVDQLMTDVYA
jgi:pyruvate dehydrogenase E1 component alpha subunit